MPTQEPLKKNDIMRETTLINGLMLADPDCPEVRSHDKTVISGNRFQKVNVGKDFSPSSGTVIDCTNCLIMPGLINCHTHGAMALLRGMADDVSLERWLNQYIFPAEARHVDSEFVYLGTLLSAAEMVLNGVTTFADGYFFMEHAARAALDMKIRAVIGQGILDVPGPDQPLPGSWEQRARNFLDAFPQDALVSPALFCHSPYLCGPETFTRAAGLARDHGILLFSHVSETSWEVSEIVSRYGLRPVDHLARLGVLETSFVAVHAIHLSEQEKHVLAHTGAKVVHCPESNMKLASGAAAIPDFLRLGIVTGLGTDGAASNNNLDLFEEMRSASFLAKLASNNPEAVDARKALRMATSEGARVLDMHDRIGSLVEGKLADVIVVDLDRPHLAPVYDPISLLVYAARGSDVRDVIVNGEEVVRDRKLLPVDVAELTVSVRAKASEMARDLDLLTY